MQTGVERHVAEDHYFSVCALVALCVYRLQADSEQISGSTPRQSESTATRYSVEAGSCDALSKHRSPSSPARRWRSSTSLVSHVVVADRGRLGQVHSAAERTTSCLSA